MTALLLEATDWGMRWANPPVAQPMPVSEVYVHHQAGRDPSVPGYGDDDPATAFRALNEAAIAEGLSATDYSMLVHTSPQKVTTIGEARGEWKPAATKDRNTQSKAVCLMGYFHPGSQWSRKPYPSELEAIAEAIVWMIRQNWVTYPCTIRGHRDNPAHPGATACPGDYLQAELPTIRQLVTDYYEEPDMTVQYFKVPGVNPLTVWATSDGLTAVRLEPATATARSVDPAKVPTVTQAEADRFVFVFGAPAVSIK